MAWQCLAITYLPSCAGSIHGTVSGAEFWFFECRVTVYFERGWSEQQTSVYGRGRVYLYGFRYCAFGAWLLWLSFGFVIHHRLHLRAWEILFRFQLFTCFLDGQYFSSPMFRISVSSSLCWSSNHFPSFYHLLIIAFHNFVIFHVTL